MGHLYAIDATKRGDITETGRLWHYDKIRRSISTGAIYNGLLFYSDFSGFLHCLDAKTGKPYWTHDMLAAVWGSPMVINGKVYLGDEDGDVVVLEAAKEKKLIARDEHGQLGLCDAGARQRHAVHHEPQRALGAERRSKLGRASACGGLEAALTNMPTSTSARGSCSAKADSTNSGALAQETWLHAARCWSPTRAW